MSDESLLAQMEALRQRFVAQLPERLRQIESALAELEQGGEAVQRAHALMHSLAGSGATFGCADVGQVAREMEYALFPADGTDHSNDAAARDRLPALLAALRAAVEDATNGTDGARAQPTDRED